MSRAPEPMEKSQVNPNGHPMQMQHNGNMQSYHGHGPTHCSPRQQPQQHFNQQGYSQPYPEFHPSQYQGHHSPHHNHYQMPTNSNMPSNMPSHGVSSQNVNVVDFKPDVMAQHNMSQMQNCQRNANSMGYTQSPASIGLVDQDGRYIPATAGGGHPYDNPYTTHPTTNADAYHQINDSHTYRPRNVSRDRTDSRHANQYARNRNPSTHSKAFNDIIDERIGTHASAVSAAKAASTASSRALSDMIDERVDVATKASASAAAAAAAKNVASKVPNVATATKPTRTEQTMTKADMDSVLKSLEATNAKTSQRENEVKMRSMIDERFHQLSSSASAKTSSGAYDDARASASSSVRTAAHPDTRSSDAFNNKSKSEQEEMVGSAVRRVFERRNQESDSGRRRPRDGSY